MARRLAYSLQLPCREVLSGLRGTAISPPSWIPPLTSPIFSPNSLLLLISLCFSQLLVETILAVTVPHFLRPPLPPLVLLPSPSSFSLPFFLSPFSFSFPFFPSPFSFLLLSSLSSLPIPPSLSPFLPSPSPSSFLWFLYAIILAYCYLSIPSFLSRPPFSLPLLPIFLPLSDFSLSRTRRKPCEQTSEPQQTCFSYSREFWTK